MDISVWEEHTASVFIVNPEDGGSIAPLKSLNLHARLHVVVSQKAAIWISDGLCGQCEVKNLESHLTCFQLGVEGTGMQKGHKMMMNRTLIEVV
jgi:hypothetical protein